MSLNRFADLHRAGRNEFADGIGTALGGAVGQIDQPGRQFPVIRALVIPNNSISVFHKIPRCVLLLRRFVAVIPGQLRRAEIAVVVLASVDGHIARAHRKLSHRPSDVAVESVRRAADEVYDALRHVGSRRFEVDDHGSRSRRKSAMLCESSKVSGSTIIIFRGLRRLCAVS